jgi:hypothetical protein
MGPEAGMVLAHPASLPAGPAPATSFVVRRLPAAGVNSSCHDVVHSCPWVLVLDPDGGTEAVRSDRYR